jgi:hypothetical protein
MLFRLQRFSRYRFLIALLCLFVALLALHTRLSPYETQKPAIKVFADFDWLKSQQLESRVSSAGVLRWIPPVLVGSVPLLLPLHRSAICLGAEGISLRLWPAGSHELVRPPPLR